MTFKYGGEAVQQARVHPPGMTVGELVDELGKAGAYNGGGSLWQAVNIYERMLRDEKALKFFGLSGAMVPGGMGGIVADLIERGHIDVLVSTGANLTHDVIEAIGCHHYHGTCQVSDTELCERVSTGSTTSSSRTRRSSGSRSSCRTSTPPSRKARRSRSPISLAGSGGRSSIPGSSPRRQRPGCRSTARPSRTR